MSGTVVVFYSYHGNVRKVAEHLAGLIGADLVELKTPQLEGLKGFLMYFRLGFIASARRCPRIAGGEADISGYENIILGSPVWAGSFSPALRSFFSMKGRRPVTAAKVGAFFCHKGGLRNAPADLDAFLGLNGRLTWVDAVEPARNGTFEKTAQALVSAMGLKTK
jgi:flavodoxin